MPRNGASVRKGTCLSPSDNIRPLVDLRMDREHTHEEICEAKVNEIDFVSISTNAHYKVTRLDVTMQDARIVNLLQSFDLI